MASLPIWIANKKISATRIKMGWELTPSNTGLVGAGIDKNDLPVYTDYLIGGIYHEPPNGTEINQKKIIHPVSCRYGDISIVKCWGAFTNGLPGGYILSYDFNTGDPGAGNIWIIDSELDGSGNAASSNAYEIAARGMINLQRNYIHDVGDGFGIFDYGEHEDIVIEDNYISDIIGYGTDPESMSHNEAGTIRSFGLLSGTTCQLTIRRNFLSSKSGHDSAALFIQAWAGPIQHALMRDNYWETINQWVVYLEMNDYGYGDDMQLINNRFKRDSGTDYIGVATGPGFSVHTDNHVYDSGDPDGKGAALD
jgi:hypothetical protein